MSNSVIKHAVGDWKHKASFVAGYNNKEDVLEVQYMLLKVSLYNIVSGINYRSKPTGVINADGSKSDTIKAIMRLEKKLNDRQNGQNGLLKTTDNALAFLKRKSKWDADQTLRQHVVHAISREFKYNMAFFDHTGGAGYGITPTSFQKSLQPRIEDIKHKDGHVRVMVIPKNPDPKAAHYRFHYNILGIEQQHSLNKKNRTSMAIHESTHALQDIFKLKFSRPWEEVGPYLVQFYWQLRNYGRSSLKGAVAKAALAIIDRFETVKKKKKWDWSELVIAQTQTDTKKLKDEIMKLPSYNTLSGSISGNG